MVSYALLWVLYSKIQYNTILYLPTLHLGVTRLFLRPWVMEWNGRCPALSDAWLHLTWRVNLNNCLAWIKILNDEFAQTFVIVDHIKNVISETSDLFPRNSFLNITDLEIRRSSQLRTLLKRVVVNRTWKNSGPYGIWTHDLCDTGAALRANWANNCLTTTRFSSVLSCEDLLISSFHRSANMWIFIYLKSL